MSSDSSSGDPRTEVEQLRRRIEMLERDNDRLREKVEPILGPDNPAFDPKIFMRVLQRLQLAVMVPVMLCAMVIPVLVSVRTPFRSMLVGWRIGPVPVIDVGGSTSGVHGFGLGIVAVGGASLGVIAMGGLAIGVVAVGGGAVGLLAIGGGAVGILAFGGGACGYISIGGGAIGYYSLAGRGSGKYVLALNRQDQQAIDLFVQYVPGLRAAVTTAMPVIPISRNDAGLLK